MIQDIIERIEDESIKTFEVKLKFEALKTKQ